MATVSTAANTDTKTNKSRRKINAKFHRAVLENNVVKVKKYLARGAEINGKNNRGRTAAHVAIVRSNFKLLLLFTKTNGFDVNAVDTNDKSLFAEACSYNYFIAFKLLMENGADVNRADVDGDSPLHYCVLNDSKTMCKFLLRYQGINVNVKEYQSKMTPLHYACMESNFEIIKMLCNHIEINLNAVNDEGETAFHLACREPENFLIVKFLIDCGCDINAKDADGFSPLDEACLSESLEIVQLLWAQQQLEQVMDIDRQPVTLIYLRINGLHRS